MKMLPNNSKLHHTSMILPLDHSYKIRDYGREQSQIPMLQHSKMVLRHYVHFSNLEAAKDAQGMPIHFKARGHALTKN